MDDFTDLDAKKQTPIRGRHCSIGKDQFHGLRRTSGYQQLHPIHTNIPRTARSVRWHPPPTGLLKVNFHGALFAEENTAGLGIIIRNDAELVMAALTQQIPLPTSVEMLEAQTTCRALWFAKGLGFRSLIVEGDSKVIINSINGGNITNLSLGISYKTFLFFVLFLVMYPFAMLRSKIIVWLIDLLDEL